MILIPKYTGLVEVAGSLSLVLANEETGEIRQEIYVPNLVLPAGKTFIASRMVGTSSAIMSHMAIGTSDTAESTAGTVQTQLGAELSGNNYSRPTLTTASNSSNVVTYTATFPANNPNAPAGGVVLREAGVFNAATGGTMLCRTVYPTVTKLPADALTITWTITIS
jgi:hypothetical protein